MAVRPGLHSRVVHVLKVGLPLVAVAMLAGLFLNLSEEGSPGDLLFTPADLAALGEGMQVTRPVLSGVTRDLDQFRFVAERVAPDAVPPTRAEITMLEGRIDFAGGPAVDVRADGGELDLGSQRMMLAGDVLLETADGYTFGSDRAEVDLRIGGLVATGSVAGSGPMGRIDAGRLTVRQPDAATDARVFLFEENVTLVYDPSYVSR